MKSVNLILPKELDEIRKYKDENIDMHLMSQPVGFLNIDVTDKNGEVIYKHKNLTRTFVNNFYVLADSQMGWMPMLDADFGEGHLNIKDINGIIGPSANDSLIYSLNMTPQVIVGNGSLPEDFNAYTLGSVIGTCTLDSANSVSAWNAGALYWTTVWKASWKNTTGTTINVSECGVCYDVYNNHDKTTIMINRDILTPSIAVADQSTLNITFSYNLYYPA